MLEIITGKDTPILRTKAKPIPRVTKDIKKLAKEMIDTMKVADGVGIAGPQVNISKRIFIATLGIRDEARQNRIETFINPKITAFSKETDIDEEGCLSLPDQFGMVQRPDQITVNYTNIDGQEQTLQLSGFDARVVQHELDHLDGVLFIDKLAS